VTIIVDYYVHENRVRQEDAMTNNEDLEYVEDEMCCLRIGWIYKWHSCKRNWNL